MDLRFNESGQLPLSSDGTIVKRVANDSTMMANFKNILIIAFDTPILSILNFKRKLLRIESLVNSETPAQRYCKLQEGPS